MSAESDRYAVLQTLVEFAKPIGQLRGLLGSIEWDFDGAPLKIERGHFRNVIERYMQGELSPQDVEDWANLVEGREDISFDPTCTEFLKKLIYELANPKLTEEISKQRAWEIIRLLSKNL